VLAYEVLTSKPLFPGESDLDQLHLIMNALGDLPESMKTCFKNNQFFANVKIPKIKTHTPLKNKLKKYSPDLVSFIMVCIRNLNLKALRLK
jgi:cyclin-dependent kinase-like